MIASRHHNCITNLQQRQCYLNFKTTVANCFLECVNRSGCLQFLQKVVQCLFLSNSCREILSVLWTENLLHSYRFLNVNRLTHGAEPSAAVAVSSTSGKPRNGQCLDRLQSTTNKQLKCLNVISHNYHNRSV